MTLVAQSRSALSVRFGSELILVGVGAIVGVVGVVVGELLGLAVGVVGELLGLAVGAVVGVAVVGEVVGPPTHVLSTQLQSPLHQPAPCPWGQSAHVAAVWPPQTTSPITEANADRARMETNIIVKRY